MKFSILFVCLLSLAAVICIWKFTDRIYENAHAPLRLFLLSFLICFVDTVVLRLFQEKYPADILNTALLKFSASLPCVAHALHSHLFVRNRFSRTIVLAMVFAMAADIAININMAAGMILFGLCHILFDIGFIREKRPNKREVLLWIAGSLAAAALLFLVRDKVGSTILLIMAMCYLSILVSTCIFSYRLSRMIWLSAIIFAVSDILLILNTAFNGSLFMRIIALLVYYGSLILYGTSLQSLRFSETC